MADEIINTPAAQPGDLGGNAGQQTVNGSQQASVAVQSSNADEFTDREKQILDQAFRNAQRLVSKSENRQSSQFQGMIDQFKAEYGVTLTPEQAQEMANNQAAKSMPNVQNAGQQSAQQATPQNDPSYQGFLYYHGIPDNQIFRQAYDIQNMLGVKLDQNDPEYQNLYNREQKYQPNEFIDAWKQACVNKMIRLQNAQQESGNQKQNTNLGQMPLVGSQGKKANTYDPNRTAKSYFHEYYEDMKK